MGPGEMVLGIVFLSMAKGTVHKYLDYRMRMVDRQIGGGERNLLRAVEEVRSEMAALKRHETDTILSFDSTLHSLDSRLQNLERRVLSEGAADRASLFGAGHPLEEPARVEVAGTPRAPGVQ